jgi:hypothetical protein
MNLERLREWSSESLFGEALGEHLAYKHAGGVAGSVVEIEIAPLVDCETESVVVGEDGLRRGAGVAIRTERLLA